MCVCVCVCVSVSLLWGVGMWPGLGFRCKRVWGWRFGVLGASQLCHGVEGLESVRWHTIQPLRAHGVLEFSASGFWFQGFGLNMLLVKAILI